MKKENKTKQPKKKTSHFDNIERNRKKFSFKFAAFLNHIIIHKPKVKYLGKKEFPNEPIMVLANHVGKKAPVKIELHYPRDFRMWGTYEMTEGFKSAHRYLRTTYYHDKKHMPKWLAFIIASLAAPFANMFYKGMRIIPTYPDARLMNTMRLSVKTYESGKDIVIYPEDSSHGYDDEIKHFFAGFVSLLDFLYNKGHDVPVYVTYLNRKTNTFIVNEQIKYSELKNKYSNNEEIAEAMRILMNSLTHFSKKPPTSTSIA